MVVKHSKSLEYIYESLDNLTQFFSSVEGGNSSTKTLSKVESVLLQLEQELRYTTTYKPQRKEN
jgi:hypothetical protein